MTNITDLILLAVFVLLCYSASLPLVIFWIVLLAGWVYHRVSCRYWRQQAMKSETEERCHIYIICPVRKVTPEQKKSMDSYVDNLEAIGFTVHYPPRDADQSDPSGMNICLTHAEAMKKCSCVHIFWDKSSTGSHFDLGMAFALDKPVYLVELFTPDGEGKSYAKVIREMENRHFNTV